MDSILFCIHHRQTKNKSEETVDTRYNDDTMNDDETEEEEGQLDEEEEEEEEEPSDAASDIIAEEEEEESLGSKLDDEDGEDVLSVSDNINNTPQTIFDQENSRKHPLEDTDDENEEEDTREEEEEEEDIKEKEEEELGEEEDKEEGDQDDNTGEDMDVDTEQVEEKETLSVPAATETKKEAPTQPVFNIPPQVVDGVAEFHVQTICQHVLCSLCRGIYREPVTTIKCQHTFCKSCLAVALHSAWHTPLHNSCPTCRTYLGRSSELSKISISDRTLEALIDKVLFPQVAAADAHAEANFYRHRGMARKEPASASAVVARPPRRRRRRTVDPWVVLTLQPADTSTMALKNPCIQVASTIRMRQLKKLILRQLDLETATTTGDQQHTTLVEISCNNAPLGDELSVQFVQRSVWMGGSGSSSALLQLTYRLLSSGKEEEKKSTPSTEQDAEKS